MECDYSVKSRRSLRGVSKSVNQSVSSPRFAPVVGVFVCRIVCCSKWFPTPSLTVCDVSLHPCLWLVNSPVDPHLLPKTLVSFHFVWNSDHVFGIDKCQGCCVPPVSAKKKLTHESVGTYVDILNS